MRLFIIFCLLSLASITVAEGVRPIGPFGPKIRYDYEVIDGVPVGLSPREVDKIHRELFPVEVKQIYVDGNAWGKYALSARELIKTRLKNNHKLTTKDMADFNELLMKSKSDMFYDKILKEW